MTMHQRWTLHVENFARFDQADITLRPLTLFVGENNSGKSYMATLLWGVLALGRTLFPASAPAAKGYKACQDLLMQRMGQAVQKRHQGSKNPEVTFSEADQTVFVDWFNEVLQQQRHKLVERLFGDPGMTIARLRLDDYRRLKPLKLTLETNTVPGRMSSRAEHSVRLPLLEDGELLRSPDLYRAVCLITWKLVAGEISAPLFGTRSATKRSDGEPLFLPASRTGFMLTYRSLVGEALTLFDAGLDEEEAQAASEFTLPVVRFLQALTEPGQTRGEKYAELGHWLENELLKGQVQQRMKGALPSYHYRPLGKNSKSLPMYLSSSLVAELTPIVHFLKHKPAFRSVFIEEPEAHLHPRAQRLMARALVRLVNAGLPVIATTHGDTLFQQLNNLVQLHGHPQRQELEARFGYGEQDLIDTDQVAAFQFRRAQQATEVRRLEQSSDGIAVPTFNEPLADLLDEVLAIQETPALTQSDT